MDDNRVNLELFLTDNTRQGMQSAGQNMTGLEQQMKEVVAILKQELTGLSRAFKEALSNGTANPSDLAEIQAMKGAIAELEQQIKDLKKETSETPRYPKVIDLAPYVTEEVDKLEDARERIKLIISNIQKDIDSMRAASVQNASSGIINPADEAKIKQLENTVRGLTEELKKYDLTKRDTYDTPIVNDAVINKTNALRMQFSQVARELPSLAMGPQMFILAISNNLPYLADAIKDVKIQNEELARSNQKTIPVWKQLLSAAFSWQTGLVVGITLLTVYGRELGNWVKSLIKGKEAMTELLSSEQEMALARSKVSDNTKKEQTELDILYTKLKDTTISSRERMAAINEWIKRYPQYANILDGENINLAKLEAAYQSLNKEIQASAIARAYADKIADNSVKKEGELVKAQNQYVTYLKAREKYNKEVAEFEEKKEKNGFSTATERYDAGQRVKKLRRAMDEEYELWKNFRQNVNQYGENISTIEQHLNAADLFQQPKSGTYDYWTQQQTRAEGVLKNIKSSIKKTLDEASKDGKNLFSLGIDKSIVESYVKASSQVKEAREKLKVYDDKKKPRVQSSTRDYETELAEARVKTRLKIENMLTDLMEDGFAKRKEIATKEYHETLAQITEEENKQLKILKDESKKKKQAVDPGKENDIKSSASFSRSLAAMNYMKDIFDINKEWQQKDENSWIEYNKQYGTYNEKKAAIAKEYALKINKDTTDGEKAFLKKQMEEAYVNLDFSQLKDKINWETIFGDMANVTKSQLLNVKNQLIAFKNSPEFKKNSNPEQIKVIEDALNNINSAITDKSGFFGGLASSMKEYKKAVDELKQSQQEYNKSVELGDEIAQKSALEKRNTAEKNLLSAQNNVEKSKDKAVDNITAVANAMTRLGEAKASISDVGNAVGSLVDALSKSGSKIGGIIASVLSMLDMIGKQGLDHFLGNIFDSLNNMTAGIWNSIGSVFGIKGAGNFFAGADYESYSKMVSQYSRLNEVWSQLIDKKKEYISISYSEEAYKAGQEAEALVQKSIDSYRKLGIERLNSGSSTGSHSIGVRQRKDMSSSDWAEAQKALGSAFNSSIRDGRMTGLFDLSVEQLEKLKAEAPTFWAKLDDDVRGYLNNIIDGQAKIEEIQKSVKEQLTQLTFDNLRSNFLDTLMDMNSDSADFFDKFQEYFERAILNDKIAALYNDRLQTWYDEFANANKSGGINSDEYAKLKEEWNKIVSDALTDRDALKEIFGWTGDESSQSGRSGNFTTLTQEQGTKLEGLFTSVQDHTSSIDQLLKDAREERKTVMEVLGRIAENTAYCRHLETMNEYLERLDREGFKMR